MKFVLLVEDDPCNRALIEDIFEFDAPGADLICAESGEEALERAAENKLSLVLMDIGLPGIDGLETTRRLKGQLPTREIPVWALTAHAMKGDEEKALAAGCEDYITKPIDSAKLTHRLRSFLRTSPG